MALKRKATFQPYDMDTAIGTNNSGVLMFGYSLEDTDTVSSIVSGGDEGGTDAPVYNAQDSVLWNNIRDAFRSEIAQMYQQLRTSGAWSAQALIQRAQEHQGKWCEAIFNEDEYYKHLIPLIDPVTKDEHGNLIRTDRYLTMLQGSKEEQRKWWLTNRFRYMDSKYVTGDAVNSVISMRVFNSGKLTLTAAIDLYLSVRFGGGSTPILQRRDANEPAEFVYTAETGVTEMETWIYSADLITDVGDLSVFYGNEFDFSRATRLQRLKIGDSASTYSNANLKALDVRNSTLLEYIDVRNCPNLAITVNLEGSPRLKEAYFDGTAITGCDLADGASVEKLHLPATITTLTLINLNKLTEFVCPDFSKVSRLMLTNMNSSIIDPVEILEHIPENSQVNIQGLYLDLAGATEIEAFFSMLDKMRGVSREKNASGEWMYHDYDTAQVSGTIHTESLTGEQIADYNARYLYITVEADHVTSYLTYASYDGSTVYKKVQCIDGVPQESAPSNPSRHSTEQYTYTFVGWSKSMNAVIADDDAETGVIADRTIYAAYTERTRTYTVRFYNGSTLLETDTGIPYGGSTTYNGATPVSPDGSAEDYPFEGWNPTPNNITGDTSCYAKFGSPVVVAEISDNWNTIFANIENGTYATKYKIGNYKPLNLGSEGTINMQIVAMDADELADGSGYAPLSFIAMELLASTMKFTANSYTSNWEDTTMPNYMQNTVKPLMPSTVRERLQKVAKTVNGYHDNNAIIYDDLLLPTTSELYKSKIYTDNDSRIKKIADTPTAYWTSDHAYDPWQYKYISTNGSWSASRPSDKQCGICLSFCLGLQQETITDSWETINANVTDGTYKTKYAVGDTKWMTLTTGEKVLMQIAGFDHHDKADGSGKAGISWVSVNLLKTSYEFNDTQKTYNGTTAYNAGGWGLSDIRATLNGNVLATIPDNVKAYIKEVSIKSDDGVDKILQTTTDKLWLPSYEEMGFSGSKYNVSGQGTKFELFGSNNARKKHDFGNTTYRDYFLRSSYVGTTNYCFRVDTDGDNSDKMVFYATGVPLCFDM